MCLYVLLLQHDGAALPVVRGDLVVLTALGNDDMKYVFGAFHGDTNG